MEVALMAWMDDVIEEVAEMKKRAKKDLDWESIVAEHDDSGRDGE